MPHDAAAQAELLRRAREEKFAGWFRGRYWRVCHEITGNREKDGFVVSYFRGHFQVKAPAVFQTPLGHKGRSGYLIQEINSAGSDLPGTQPHPFGRKALEHAISLYHSVTGLPERDPRRHGVSWLP